MKGGPADSGAPTARRPPRLSVIFPLALEIWWFGGGVIYFNMRLYVYHAMLIWSVLIQGHEGMPER